MSFDSNLPQSEVVSRSKYILLFLGGLVACVLSIVVSWSLQAINTSSNDFPTNTPITIAPGSSARAVADQFASAGYVRSAWLLYLSLIWWYDPTDIKAATYVFTEPLSPRALAREITTGHFAHDLIKITIPEGARATTIAAIAAATLPRFDSELFLLLATNSEGKLFPDTYLVPETYSAEEFYALLTTTYQERVYEPYFAAGASKENSLTEDEMVILASILEREANTRESMGLVAGILHNRLRIGMALQVDASMEYVLDKPLKELDPTDLDIDSPYNTYLYPGLPPTPIGNPGLTAIQAVLQPTPSDFFYYITGNDGQFYYARTYVEHQRNIERYLR